MSHYPNKDDFNCGFWDNNYRILLTAQGIEFVVNANNESEAFDFIIDYCEENMPGLLFSIDEVDSEKFLGDYITGGNHGRTLNTYNVRCIEIEMEKHNHQSLRDSHIDLMAGDSNYGK